MTIIDPTTIPVRDMYNQMVRAITPRPIAWVSTISAKGIPNLAPYSFFNGVSANPPSVVFSPVNRRDGSKKDTVINIEHNGQFVVNMVPFSLAEPMNLTSAEFDPDVNEFEVSGMTAIPSERISPPRVAQSPIAFECELIRFVHIGEGPLAANLVIGKILLMHISNDVLDSQGNIDADKVDAVGRMGGASYSMTRQRFDLARPEVNVSPAQR
jgi:flavin reductase (DIM6/NTAB) family NADH-FMN oxidoreductase RutF